MTHQTERSKFHDAVIGHIALKVRHALLVRGATPEFVDHRLRWKRGTTAGLLARPRKMKLDDISDIGTALGVQFNFKFRERETT